MARPLRLLKEDGFYHVMARGIERRDLFRSDVDRKNFMGRLSELPTRFKVQIHAYVLMDNHYHLLIQPKGLNLSQAIQWLNVGYGVWFNRKHRRVGPLFQGRCKAILVEDEKVLVSMVRYLHLNPVRIRKFGWDTLHRKRAEKGLDSAWSGKMVPAAISHLKAYRWSSYRAWVGLEKAASWLSLSLRGHEGPKGHRVAVEQGIRMGMPESPWEGMVVDGFLGSREGLEKLKAKLVGNRSEQKGVRQSEGLLEWSKFVTAVEQSEGGKWEELCQRYGIPARDLALWFGRKHGGMRLTELGAKAGMNYPAVYEAVRRIDKQLPEQKQLKQTMNRIKQILTF
jgi:REP element-mobilizing transposase RayT